MIDKNPYEKNEDVNVPNFKEMEDKGADPIFNMDTTSISSNTDSFDIEEEAESSSKTAIVVLIVFLVLFLVGAVTGWIFGITKSGEVSKVTDEFDAYKVKVQKQINDLESQVSTLQAEIVQSQSNSDSQSGTTDSGSTSTGSGTKTEANTYYAMNQDVKVRSGAGTSYGIADYDKLPNEIKDLVLYDKASKTITTKKAKFPVYETKEDSSKNLWGRIADNAWVCIKYGNEEWGKKQ